MFAFSQESCTGCTGPERQMCEVRPARRTLLSFLPSGAAPVCQPARIAAPAPVDARATEPARSWIVRVKAALAGLRARAAERQRHRQIALELSRLDDRTLRDIGISRPEIEASIAHARRGGR